MIGPHPLEQGERVAIETTIASKSAADDLRQTYGAPADLVQLAVPAGTGVLVEFFLRRVFGGELIGDVAVAHGTKQATR